MSIPQILVSKYCSPIKMELGLLEEGVDLKARTKNIQDDPGAAYSSRNQLSKCSKQKAGGMSKGNEEPT